MNACVFILDKPDRINQELRGSIKMAVDNAEHNRKNIIRRLVPLYNALQDFGPSGLVKKAHYLGNNMVHVSWQTFKTKHFDYLIEYSYIKHLLYRGTSRLR